MAGLTPEQEAALARVRNQATQGSQQLTPAQQQALGRVRGGPEMENGLEVVQRFDQNNGRILKNEDGSLVYVDANMSTMDQDRIQRIMSGQDPLQTVRQDMNEERIAANPVLARANEFQRGFPFVGSYIDDAYEALGFSGKAENARQMTQAMQAERPGQTTALNVAGAITGSVPVAMAAGPALMANAGRSIGARALQGLGLGSVIGAAEGGIYGYGEGQGAERAENARTGALLGGAMGGLVGGAAPYAASGLRSLLMRLRGSDVQTISREMQISPQAAAVVRQALASGDDDAAMAALERAGDDAMLADANPFTRNLLDTAAQSPSQAGQIARDAVADRTREAAFQMEDALDRFLGPPRGEREIVGEIAQQSSGARSAAYDAAYAAAIDYTAPQARSLERLLERVPDSAIRRANELMRIRGEQSAQIMARVGDDGSVVFERMPDVRQLDYITRALNDVASEADGAGKLGGQTDLGASIQNLSRAIRTNVRQLVPEYGAALDTAADAIGQRNAVETGYDLLRSGTRREDIARALNGASQAERTAMMQGVRSFIDDVTANVTRTITDDDVTAREGIQILRQMSSRANETKLRMLLGRQADELLAEIDRAATAYELRAAITQNSRTYARTAMNDAVRDQTTPGIVSTLAQGEPINASKRIVQALTGETDEAIAIRQMGLYEEIAQALVNQRGMQAQRSLQMMQSAIAGQELNEQQARVVANAVVSALGSGAVQSAGREVGLRQ